jgi:hypothetical protein
MYQNFIIRYLYEAQHASGDTPSIIRSLNCTASLWFFIRGRLFVVPDNVHQLHVQQPSTHEEPEAASTVLGS